MCGIAGSWGIDVNEDARRRALDAIARRGPDAHAWWAAPTAPRPVYLGHRRLSIIDLSDVANQPLHKGNLHIVYNGEIYNYRELRAELSSLGASFQTQSDTEVVVEAFRQWGIDCFRRLRGMFALALYDDRTGELTLARDPFGIKPLFLWRTSKGIAFASEIKALVAMGAPADIDRDAIAASMMFMWLPTGISAFRAIERLEPGHVLQVGPKGESTTCFWDARTDLVERRAESECSIDELRRVMEDAVAVHMIADVPVSTFLSGGLDSSIITVLAKRHNPDLEAYTIRIPDADHAQEGMPQDVHYARKLAAQEGIRLHEIEVSPDIVEALPRMMSVLDEPISDPATLNVMLICEAARDAGAKVLLSGMGADELFGGYRRHQAMMLAQPYRALPGIVRKAVASAVAPLPISAFGRGLTPIRWAKRFLALAGGGSTADAYLRSYSYYDGAQLARIAPATGADVFARVRDQHAGIFETDGVADLPNRMNLTDLFYFLPGLNLSYTDRGSMYASTEVRTPFVDLRVAEAAFRIAGDRKTSARQTKIALKKAAEAWLPHEIIYRPKASFGVPLRSWVKGPLAGRIQALVSESRLVSEGHISPLALSGMIADFQAGRTDFSYQLWHLLALETWLQGVSVLGHQGT